VASVDEVDGALRELVHRLHAVDEDTRGRHALERTVSLYVLDHDLLYTAQFVDGSVCDLTTEPRAPAQVRLEAESDDVLALCDGRLGLPSAWAAGRLKVEASLLDLVKLRTLL
jgi:putative sterol carrier protein